MFGKLFLIMEAHKKHSSLSIKKKNLTIDNELGNNLYLAHFIK